MLVFLQVIGKLTKQITLPNILLKFTNLQIWTLSKYLDLGIKDYRKQTRTQDSKSLASLLANAFKAYL